MAWRARLSAGGGGGAGTGPPAAPGVAGTRVPPLWSSENPPQSPLRATFGQWLMHPSATASEGQVASNSGSGSQAPDAAGDASPFLNHNDRYPIRSAFSLYLSGASLGRSEQILPRSAPHAALSPPLPPPHLLPHDMPPQPALAPKPSPSAAAAAPPSPSARAQHRQRKRPRPPEA